MRSKCRQTLQLSTFALLKYVSRHFERLAVGVLSECYSSDEHRTHRLLVRKLPLFGQSTNVALAVEADNKVFIAHAACQTLFSNIWAGELAENHEAMVRGGI